MKLLTMKNFFSDNYVPYDEVPERISWTVIHHLQFLYGKKWDQTALNYVHALRPSGIRVTKRTITCNSKEWRVTVVINEDETIRDIYQEVEVGCIGYDDAYLMDCIIGNLF